LNDSGEEFLFHIRMIIQLPEGLHGNKNGF
jgi:hypothetical protein